MTTHPDLNDLIKTIEQITHPGPEEEGKPQDPSQVEPRSPAPVQYKNILVGYDGSEGAQDALAWAQWLAPLHDAKITLALVLPPSPQTRGGGLTAVSREAEGTINAILEDDLAHGSQMLQDTRDRLQARGFSCESVLAQGRPAAEFLRLPELKEADLVILGAHQNRGGPEHLLLGSVCNAVAEKAPTDVLIARGPPPVERSLLAVDGSPLSHQTAVALHALALPAYNHEIQVVHVVPQPFAGFSSHAQRMIEETLPQLQEELERRSQDPERPIRFEVLFGKPAERILETARTNDVDLIACGSHRMGRIQGWLLGSVSNQIIHRARCNVLLVREREEKSPNSA